MTTKVQRPWGWYETIQEESNYKVKRLYVKPGEKISLQFHNYRSEHWIVVSGSGKIELDGNITDVTIGDYVFIPILSKHRIAAGDSGITIIEVQLGSKCLEEDIVRIEDDYGRI